MKRQKNIPDGFGFHRSGRVELVYNKRTVSGAGMNTLLELPQKLELCQGMSSRSRRMVTVWKIADYAGFTGEVIARQYVHGGFYGAAAGRFRTLYLNASPMLRELRIADHLLRRGIPTSTPVALRFERTLGPFFSVYLISEKLPGTENLLSLCGGYCNEGRPLITPLKGLLLEKIAASTARLHEAGVYHGDLNLKNILVELDKDGSVKKVYLIDFKKAKLCGQVSMSRGISNIKRLWRSIRKWPDSASVFNRLDYTTLLEYYRAERERWRSRA